MAMMLNRRLSLAAFSVPHFRAGASASRQTKSHASSASSLIDMIKQKNSEHDVMVYSKSWCPYCYSVKELFKYMDVSATYAELDELADGSEVQGALEEVTGSHTVPQIFIKGQFIGGASETQEAYHDGSLVSKLDEAGIQHK